MLLVFLSHFCQVYFVERPMVAEEDFSLGSWGMMIGQIATPTFILTSGLVVGYLYQSRRADWSRLRIHLIDRAIFLVTVGHLVISLFTATRSGSLGKALFTGYVTDTIAFCVLLGVTVVSRITPLLRLTVAGALYAMAWIAWSYWNPAVPSWIFLKAVFIGPHDPNMIWFWFPFLPWVSLYLGGSFLGAYVGSQNVKELHTSVAISLIKIAAGALALSVLATAIYQYLKYSAHTNLPAVWYESVSIYQKYPPGPVYFLFFGGIGLMMIGLWCRFERVWEKQVSVRGLVELGQYSVVAFLFQYLVYNTVLVILVTKTSLAPVGLWPVYLPASVALLLFLVRTSRRADLIRFCTVGLPVILRGGREPRVHASASPVCGERLRDEKMPPHAA